ncbi:MAG: OadG family protein [Lachnospiraceae bacterium]|nr:OadG family protein [Lachnospiraceae bacterium]
MKSIIKKALALVMFAALSISLAGCGGNEEDLPITDMSYAMASGIMGGISNTDESAAAEFLDMDDDELEDFFGQYGYSIDGAAFKNGLDGWLSLSEEFGEIESISEPEMSSDSDEITATFDITGSLRDGKCVFVMDHRTKITSITTSAEYTLAEDMSKAGLNTLLGMGTTFVILIFLSLIISLFKFLPGAGGAKAKQDKKSAPVDNAVSQIAEREELAASDKAEDEGELIAVITAAIAAYEAVNGGGSSDGFVVRSIRRHY